jgi:cytochrome oxidase Cu insertion factor (SCO1/SenC/PrrC family)
VNRLPTPSRRLLGVLVAAPFIIAACTTTSSESPEATPSEAAIATETAQSAPAAALEPTPEPEAAAWLEIELTDAATGETFTLASLAGEVVAIEPMAIWCSNCKAQQDNVKSAYAEIVGAGVRYLSLGIDPSEKPSSLAKYAERRGYEWTFAQSPVEFSRELSDLFGPQILSAPSTPLIVLDAEGELFTQEFGFHGPEKLLDILAEAGT